MAWHLLAWACNAAAESSWQCNTPAQARGMQSAAPKANSCAHVSCCRPPTPLGKNCHALLTSTTHCARMGLGTYTCTASWTTRPGIAWWYYRIAAPQECQGTAGMKSTRPHCSSVLSIPRSPRVPPPLACPPPRTVAGPVPVPSSAPGVGRRSHLNQAIRPQASLRKPAHPYPRTPTEHARRVRHTPRARTEPHHRHSTQAAGCERPTAWGQSVP